MTNANVYIYFLQEEKKILFYHPSEVEKNEKIRNVGLCEAIVQFTRYNKAPLTVLFDSFEPLIRCIGFFVCTGQN